VVPADRAVPVLPGVDLTTAAAVMLQGCTAHYLASSTWPVSAGDVAVVHAAAGGVGALLTQIVRLRGGVVVATTSGGQKAIVAADTGAQNVATYDDFVRVARDMTGGAGAHVVYDGVGRTTFDDSLRALRRRGTMVLYGAASGPIPPVDPLRLQTGDSLYLTRPSVGRLHRHPGRSGRPHRRAVRLDRRRQAHRPHRRHVPAGGRRPGAGGPDRPADDRQAAAHAVSARPAAPV
jgi:NADPH:quinone reductase